MLAIIPKKTIEVLLFYLNGKHINSTWAHSLFLRGPFPLPLSPARPDRRGEPVSDMFHLRTHLPASARVSLSTSPSSSSLAGARRRGKWRLRVSQSPQALFKRTQGLPVALGFRFSPPLLAPPPPGLARPCPVPPVSARIRRRPCSFSCDWTYASSCLPSQPFAPCRSRSDAVN